MKLKTKSQLKDILNVIVYLIPIIFLVAVIAQYAVAITKELGQYEYQLQNFIKIEPKVTAGHSLIKEAEAKEPAAMTTEEYICTFNWNCKIAIAIIKAESGFNSYAINQNNDHGRTFDLGCWQLNEKWQLKPRGLDRAHAFDCKKSTETAYIIYQEWNNTFQAWSSYKSRSYLKHL